jgi:predicted kinase
LLIILGGLPGTGKTALARALCHRWDAMLVRIDTIEVALRLPRAAEGPLAAAGYHVAYAVAEDNLRLGRLVIADSVNPVAITRTSWHDVARRSGAAALDVEVICSDPEEHRRRLETRVADLAGQVLPSWSDVLARAYEPRAAGDAVVVDTARMQPGEAAGALEPLVEALLAITGSGCRC